MHPERGEGVEDSADDDGESRGAAALAAGRDAKRVGRRQHFDNLGREGREIVRARHSVIHKRSTQELPRCRIDRALLPHCLADTLGGAAMGLAVHDQRVDAASDIVDDGIAGNVDPAGLGIDLDLADGTAIGKDRIVHLVVGDDRELVIQTEAGGLLRQFEKINAAIAARR